MLLQELKEIKSGRRERHQFGIVIAVALFIVGAFLAWRRGVYPEIFIAGLIVVAPVLFDKLFKTDTAIVLLPFQKVWMAIAVIIGAFVSRIILGLFFFGVFTSVRVVNRFVGKPLLDTIWAPGGAESHWIRREPGTWRAERSEKQY